MRFLDWANGRLERAIRAKRKVIALLNEQKQAIIHRAVTRCLDPSVPLKPSGIPWLGEIPQHWEAPRVKQCARKISKGTTPSTEGREILEFGPVRFLKAENISAGRIADIPLCFIDEETNRMIRRSQLAENDILFVIAGATLGKTAVVSDEVLPANTNQAVAFIRPNNREITLLREYRTRLVADVVTGKLDVREAAARLPEEGGGLSDGSDESDMSHESETADEEAAV